MRPGAILLPLALLCATPAWAQDEARAHSLAPGAWALQFGIAQDFLVHAFSGTTISVKRHASANTAFRLGIAADFRDLEDEVVLEQADSLVQWSDRTAGRLGLELQLVHYPHPGRTVNLFFGGGPVAFWRHSRDEDGPESPFEFTDRTWNVGLGGFVGAEWFATRSIGLHAEYGTDVLWYSSRRTRRYPGEPQLDFTETSKGWSVTGRGVRFGGSLYF